MNLKLFELSATLGLDDSAYRQGIQNVQSETKKTVSSLSGEYSKAAKAVVELTRRYNESVGKTGKASSETKNLKTMLAQAEAQLRATTTALKAANNGMDGFANSTDKASGKSLASAITQGTVMANVFSKLGSAALSAAEGFISSGIEYNAQIEKYTTGFTNMLGSAEAAQQVMSQIQEDAAKTPFDVESLTQANQYLISAGENASYARNTIMALGDAVSATGGGNDELNRMSQNLQQIANTGKATAADIKQFAYAGIDVYGILADYTGKSTTEVQKMTISYDLLTQALQAASEEGGRYYNSMDTQSQTMNGRMSTLQDNVKQLAGLLTGDLSSGFGVVIGNLNDMLVAAQEAYKTDGWIGLAGAITGLTEPINTAKNALKDFASKATTWLDQLSYKLNRFLGKAATADFDTYEEYADANNRKSNRNRMRENALNGIGISNKSWSERQAELAAASGNGGSSITTSPSGSSTGKKSRSSGSKSTTETVISSISSTATTTAQNALGTVTTSIQTLTEKVKDSSGKIKDRITETTTTTGKEMVNGVATTFKQVETKVNGTVTKVTKTYDDMSKTLLGTFTNVSETTFDGITTKVQQAVEKYADGSEHIKKTVTETGQRVGENGAETYEKIITYIDGIEDKVNETSTLIDKSVKGTQNRIDQQLSEASGQLDKGIFGLVKSVFSDAKNGDWASLGLDFVNLIWGEVSQGQRDVISKWLADAAAAVNEGYFSGGIGKAFDIFQKLFSDGGVKSDIDGVTNSVKAFGEIIDGLAKSGGVGGALGSIVQSFSGMAGGITSALGTIVSFVAANPILALILGVGAVAGGIGLALWMNKKNNQKPVSHYQSPFDKTGVYDSLGTFSTRAALQYRVTGQQSIVDRQTSILERIEGMLDEHLPDIGKGQVVMDSGELVGVLSPRMATNVDARIGVTVTRKARGV
nr:MAG TPA: tail tape measure protein [Caudoviricetes sp.]